MAATSLRIGLRCIARAGPVSAASSWRLYLGKGRRRTAEAARCHDLVSVEQVRAKMGPNESQAIATNREVKLAGLHRLCLL